MTKADMISALAYDTKCPTATARAALHRLCRDIAAEIALGEPVRLPGIGTLRRVATAAKQGRNPLTLKEVAIPAGYRARFVAAKGLKEQLKELCPPSERVKNK